MATPKLVSLLSGPSSGGALTQLSPYTQQFVDPTEAGCLLLAYIFVGQTAVPTPTMATNAVTDDQGQTWTRVLNAIGGTNGLGFLFKMENTAANVRKVTFVIGGTNPPGVCIVLKQIRNVLASAATGLTWSTEGTVASTAWDSGAAQTPTAGSSIYHVASVANSGIYFATGVTAPDVGVSAVGTNYQMEFADIMNGFSQGQSWEGATATSHSPTLTVATANEWMSMAIEVFAGTGGSDSPNGSAVRCVGMDYNHITTTTQPYQFPCTGNLILVDVSTGSDSTHTITGMTGATYTQHGASPKSDTLGGSTIQHFHADNNTPSRSLNGVVTWAAAPNLGSGGCIWFRDIKGMETSPLDTGATGSGGLSGASGALSGTFNQTVAGNLDVGTVTPSAGTRLVTVYSDDASGSDIGMADTTVNFLLPYANGDGGSGNFYALDSGFASKIVTSAQNFTFTRSATAAGFGEVLAAAYKVATSAGGNLMTMGVG